MDVVPSLLFLTERLDVVVACLLAACLKKHGSNWQLPRSQTEVKLFFRSPAASCAPERVGICSRQVSSAFCHRSASRFSQLISITRSDPLHLSVCPPKNKKNPAAFIKGLSRFISSEMWNYSSQSKRFLFAFVVCYTG